MCLLIAVDARRVQFEKLYQVLEHIFINFSTIVIWFRQYVSIFNIKLNSFASSIESTTQIQKIFMHLSQYHIIEKGKLLSNNLLYPIRYKETFWATSQFTHLDDLYLERPFFGKFEVEVLIYISVTYFQD